MDHSLYPKGMFIRTPEEVNKGYSAKEALRNREITSQKKVMHKRFIVEYSESDEITTDYE